MKNYFVLGFLATLLLSGCKTSQLVSFNDDVYVDPAEEKEKMRLATNQKLKADSILQLQREQAQLAEEAKKPVNPYYKDVDYNSDDYYDYQYASRINRFHSPILGAGYYDPFYTNCYTYNQNPLMYGTSIYSTYNYWMPSTQFGLYNNIWNTGFNSYGFGNGWCNNNFSYWNQPCYNSWAYPSCGWNSYPTWQYGYAYPTNFYNGWNNGYSGWNIGQWGYFNSFDSNSGYATVDVGPRGGFNGFGASNRSNGEAQMRPEPNPTQQYMASVNQEQSSRPRFSSSRMSRTNQAARNQETPAKSRTEQNNASPGSGASTRVTRQTSTSSSSSTNSSRESNNSSTNTNNGSGGSNRLSRRLSESNSNNSQNNSNFFNRENNQAPQNNYTPPSNSDNGSRGGGGGSGSSPRSGGGGRPR